MSELDWMQRSFIVLGCFLSGCILIAWGILGEGISINSVYVAFPLVFHGVVFGKVAFLGAGAICLGVQTHFYNLQKKIIEVLIKGIE